jgi:hypothetical protein
MLTGINSSVFSNSDSIGMLPIVSAEWNHNLFNPPYITVAGPGTAMSLSLSSSSGAVSSVTSEAKPNFTTKSMPMLDGKGFIEYAVTANNKNAYKIITYVKTSTPTPVMVTSFAEGPNSEFGSAQEEATSLGWTKITTFMGSPYFSEDTISSFTYRINLNTLSGIDENPTVYFTVPQVYETSYINYVNDSLWPTDSVFQFFRPGESYVSTGNTNCSLPSNYRKINTSIINGYSGAHYAPVSSITQTPSFFFAAPPVPGIKSSLPTDISPYKYFVSDPIDSGTSYTPTICGIYEKPILSNKIVIKFNTLITTPTIKVKINDAFITVDGSENISIPANSDSFVPGVLILYWTGSAWTKTKWSEMPAFTNSGSISKATTISKISVTQISVAKRSQFDSYTSQDAQSDFKSMHIIELSPRLEIDLSSFVENVSIEKSLDSQSTVLPISSVNADTMSVRLSSIPLINNNSLVNIFSSQSDNESVVLKNLLRKNVKFYVNFNVFEYADLSAGTVSTSNYYIPGGVFYSDNWDEEDINTVSVQCFDVSRYLQSMPAPDYVANLKSVFEIITNILDTVGFTDYDYDSLYKVCNNKAIPMDISYFYCNSKDSTVIDVLNKIFIAYQIGCFIDEYGVMKFLSLYDILSSTNSVLSISDFDIQQEGFSLSNKAKPGKISLRYQSPKVKQSPSLQNVTNPAIADSPSFVYTTSNDVVWQQQSIDSVGFNYIKDGMDKDSNVLNINVNDLQNIFHTFNRDASGYVFIENEITSFLYKEYRISKADNTSVLVSIKNNLELESEINKFIKQYSVGLKTSDGTEKQDYDVIVTPTGNITNVQRGMFGTLPAEHKRITTLASKGLVEKLYDQDATISASSGYTSIIDDGDPLQGGDAALPSIDKIGISGDLADTIATNSYNLLIFPENEVDHDYQTYSVKFDMPHRALSSAGLFFNMESNTSPEGAFFVELLRINQIDPKTSALYSPPLYKYVLMIYGAGEMFWSEVTGECTNIVDNFSKIIKKTQVGDNYSYSYVSDNPFNLKVVHYLSDGTDGEDGSTGTPKRIVSAFINNVEIVGWQKAKIDDYDSVTNPGGSGWQATEVNKVTGMRQKPSFTDTIQSGRKFGFTTSVMPIQPAGIHPLLFDNPLYDEIPVTPESPSSLREIHATQKPLKERSVSYFYQDREFLNGLIQGQPLYGNSKTYIMQTTPEISGINYYDVQYTTPAAVSVDVLPVEYMWKYYPGNSQEDQIYYAKKLVDEYSLSYSTPINTGFRAKMAIANNSSHVVFLHKESDSLNEFTVNLNLWTHEIVAPSDPEILETVIDYSNLSEVAQIDSEWIQSKQSAQRILKVVSMAVDGFSKTVSLNLFGNPLIQIGDVVTLSYSLNGISNQKYFVSSISHSFEQGLTTNVSLNRLP